MAGKESRRPNRRNRPGRQRERPGSPTNGTTGGPKPFKIVVATSPQSGSGGVSLAHEVELVKSALLYADHVELLSAGAAMLGAFAFAVDGGADRLWDVLEAMQDDAAMGLAQGALPPNWRQQLPLLRLASKGHPGIDRVVGDLQDNAEQMMISSGAADLVPALDAGVLTLSASGLAENMGSSQEMVTNYLALLRQHLEDPNSRLLFDGEIAGLVRSMVAENDVEPHRLALLGAGQAATGSGLIGRLPAVISRPMDELLDLRSDLVEPLTRYRKAVAELSGTLTAQAYESESAVELERLYVERVEPVLLDIRQAMADHGLVREVLRDLRSDVQRFLTTGVGAGGTVLVGVETMTGLAGATAVGLSGALGAGAALVDTTARAGQRGADGRRDAERRELFYLHELDRQTAE